MTEVSPVPVSALDGIDAVKQENVDENCESTLWHYTDAAGLFGILTTGKIWATHIAHLNDPSELVHGENLAAVVAEEFTWPKVMLNAARALKDFKKTWSAIPMLSVADLHVASFCKDDGNRLSQWRGYGGACLGYSIGLKKINRDPDETGLMFRVRYEAEPTADQLKAEFAKVLRALENDIRAGFDQKASTDKAREKMGEIASMLSLKLKHAGFKEENEWRFVTFPSEPGANSRVSVSRYRATRRGLVPYVDVDLTDPSGLLPLERIFVGPGHEASASVRAVVGLLRSLNYPDPELLVAPSEIPFRAT